MVEYVNEKFAKFISDKDVEEVILTKWPANTDPVKKLNDFLLGLLKKKIPEALLLILPLRKHKMKKYYGFNIQTKWITIKFSNMTNDEIAPAVKMDVVLKLHESSGTCWPAY